MAGRWVVPWGAGACGGTDEEEAETLRVIVIFTIETKDQDVPINLYFEKDMVTFEGLQVDDWDLPTQLDKLEQWVLANWRSMNNGPYVADIGLMVRENACGGGAVLAHETMKIMADIKLSIHFSEYVGHAE